jgi:hypothetical protein
LVVAAIVLIVGTVANYFYLADLRPASLEEDTIAAREKGAARLAALAEAHGEEAWRGFHVMDVKMSDAWHGTLMQRFWMPWETSPQELRARFIRGSWTGEVALLDGPHEGRRWGIQGWKTWTAERGGEARFAEDETIEFVVPTMQYFLELPLRIQSATVALEAGQEAWRGKAYDLVFATWDTPVPVDDMDQYLLWIDSETGLLARADYTVRDQGDSVLGSAHYLDYERFDGVALATRIELFALMPGGMELPVHTFIVEDVEWDTVKVDALRPDPKIPHEGETKPSF